MGWSGRSIPLGGARTAKRASRLGVGGAGGDRWRVTCNLFAEGRWRPERYWRNVFSGSPHRHRQLYHSDSYSSGTQRLSAPAQPCLQQPPLLEMWRSNFILASQFLHVTRRTGALGSQDLTPAPPQPAVRRGGIPEKVSLKKMVANDVEGKIT